jgi:hypothetical protein
VKCRPFPGEFVAQTKFLVDAGLRVLARVLGRARDAAASRLNVVARDKVGGGMGGLAGKRDRRENSQS